ncbi:MAG: PP2C family serine/threonine-protein phosphatase, partial [Pseudomonadota bacterium]
MKDNTNSTELPYLKLCQEILRCRGEVPEITKIEDFIERSEIRGVLEMSSEKVFQSWNQWQKQYDGKEMSWQSSQVRFKLPNATVGKDYEEILYIESMGNVEVIRIDGLDELGLRYIQKRVQGSPSKAGEYPLSVHYHFPDSQYQRTAQQQTLNLVINNDPKKLWKNIPSDQNMKFWKQDEDKQEKEGQDGWKLVAASKRGRSHAHGGTCRDDDFVIISPNNVWHILAVSDGAGSSQYARKGAEIAVKRSTEILSSKLDEYDDEISKLILECDENTDAVRQILYNKVFRQVIYETFMDIHNTAKENGYQYRDLYATLLIAAHKVVAGKHLVIAYWIGDGALALYKEKEYIKLLGENDSGEYAGQTRFLDKKAVDEQDIMSRIRFDCQDSMTALFLMTDGITDPIFDSDDNLRQLEYWDRFFHSDIQKRLSEIPSQTAQNLLDWLDFWSPGNHDDRTLALIYHPES